MLPLGILNASTKNVRMKPNNTTDTIRIFAHSPRKLSPLRPLLSSRSASSRCSGVIARDPDTSVEDSLTGADAGGGEGSLGNIASLLIRRPADGGNNR